MHTFRTNFIAISLFSIALCLTSCEDNEEKTGTAVQTIEAEANFDLSYRSDWVLLMGGYIYDFTVEGKKLQGHPKNAPFHFSYGLPSSNGADEITLFHPQYLESRASLPPIVNDPAVIDQSTLFKFTYYDPLRGPYIGEIVSDIKNITLYHFNALLSFRLSGVTEDAKVFIKQPNNSTVLPLQDEEDKSHYKAIVFPQNGKETLELIVEINGETYQSIIPWGNATQKKEGQIYDFKVIGNSTLLTFTVRIDEKGKLVFENMEIEAWCSEWPITD